MSAIASVLATTSTATAATSSTSNSANNIEIVGNFTEFLQLLTTQLQNQDPLSPLDTNGFTEQLVEYVPVEQQLKANNQLSTPVSLEQTAHSTAALGLVGVTVMVNSSTVPLANNSAAWTLAASTLATARDDYHCRFDCSDRLYRQLCHQPRPAEFHVGRTWYHGKQWPDGNYVLTVTAVDASGQSTAISMQVPAKVDSVDLTPIDACSVRQRA